MRKIIFRIVLSILIIVLAVVSLLVGTGYSMYSKALKETSLEDKIMEIKNEENYTKIDEICDIYKKAVIAVEDHRFYQHKGIDTFAIARAVVKNVTSKELKEGGSTITQQLAKNTYFTQNKEITRKIAEGFMAKKYEKNFSKDEILELYINTCYFGDGYYTIREASLGYFDKLPSELNDFEATMLAGIPNAPSVYAPTVNYELACQRQKQVLTEMVKYGYINEGTMNEIISHKEEYREFFNQR